MSHERKVARAAHGASADPTKAKLTGPLFYDHAYELPNPGTGLAWCNRCMKADGKDPAAAAYPVERTFLIEGTKPPLVAIVCERCVGPDDVVIQRGGGWRDEMEQAETERRVRNAQRVTEGGKR